MLLKPFHHAKWPSSGEAPVEAFALLEPSSVSAWTVVGQTPTSTDQDLRKTRFSWDDTVPEGVASIQRDEDLTGIQALIVEASVWTSGATAEIQVGNFFSSKHQVLHTSRTNVFDVSSLSGIQTISINCSVGASLGNASIRVYSIWAAKGPSVQEATNELLQWQNTSRHYPVQYELNEIHTHNKPLYVFQDQYDVDVVYSGIIDKNGIYNYELVSNKASIKNVVPTSLNFDITEISVFTSVKVVVTRYDPSSATRFLVRNSSDGTTVSDQPIDGTGTFTFDLSGFSGDKTIEVRQDPDNANPKVHIESIRLIT